MYDVVGLVMAREEYVRSALGISRVYYWNDMMWYWMVLLSMHLCRYAEVIVKIMSSYPATSESTSCVTASAQFWSPNKSCRPKTLTNIPSTLKKCASLPFPSLPAAEELQTGLEAAIKAKELQAEEHTTLFFPSITLTYTQCIRRAMK